MKRIQIFYNIFILLLFFKSDILLAKVENKIIANVGNQIITAYELKNKIKISIILNNQELNQNNVNRNKKKALTTLVNYKLKKIELIKYSALNEEIDTSAYIINIAKNYNVNVETFKNIFIDNSLDYDLYLEEVKTELNWQQLILSIYRTKVQIDEEQINIELQELIKKQKEIEEYKLAEIEVITKNISDINSSVQEIKDQIREFGFENTAIKYSASATAMDAGFIGWINSRSLSDIILTKIQNLKINEISEPIVQPNSVLFIKILDKKKSNLDVKNINGLKNKILTQKRNELFNLFSSSHLSKLRNNLFIEFK